LAGGAEGPPKGGKDGKSLSETRQVREPGEVDGAAEVRQTAEVRETEEAREPAVAAAGEDGEVLRRYRQRFTRPGSAQAYEQRFRTRKRVTDRLEVRAVGRALSSLGDLGRVLDVPAGAGRFLPLLRERAAEVVASDVSAEMLQLARAPVAENVGEPRGSGGRAPGPVPVVEADLLALPFAEGSFDAVVCIRFLHHLRSGRLRVAGLRELARVSSRYLVVTFFDYASVWALRQAWCHLRGKVKPWAVPLARFQAEAAQAGLRFLRSVHVLPGLSEEQVLVFEKDPAVASAVMETPQSVSSRLRAGHWLNATAWLWIALLVGLIFLCHWRELEGAEFVLWPPGVALMLVGAALLVWTYRSRRRVLEEPPGGAYALSRHPALLGATLWLCGFALTCELWWMALAVWFVVPGGLWLAIEYTEARQWLRDGQAYDLYAQGTSLFLPNGRSLRSLWQQARSPVSRRAPGGRQRAATSPRARAGGVRRLTDLAGLWFTVGLWALCVAGGAALALLKELSSP
jgi:SAM-dependent methyltransferase